MKTLIKFITFSEKEFTIERENFNKKTFYDNLNNIKFLEIDDWTLINIKDIKEIQFKEKVKRIDYTSLLE